MLSRAEAAAALPVATLLQRLRVHSPYAGLCAIAVFALLLRLGSILPLGGTGRWMDPNTDPWVTRARQWYPPRMRLCAPG